MYNENTVFIKRMKKKMNYQSLYRLFSDGADAVLKQLFANSIRPIRRAYRLVHLSLLISRQ